MIPQESNIIGKGGHWIVERITINENGQEVSVVRKHGKPGKVDENIAAFELISKAGLPTLKKYVKISEQEIEAEDLNADTSCGYFVSPNTVRGCSTCGDIFMKIINSDSPTQFENEQCKEFDFNGIIKRISENGIDKVAEEGVFDQLRDKKIVRGAEGEVYNNRVSYISNLNSFWLHAKGDMGKASKNNIELYPDAFFFKVNPNSGEIEYTIADFDCIRDLSRFNDCYDALIKGNVDHLKTALYEYIMFFVIEEKQDEYIERVNNFK